MLAVTPVGNAPVVENETAVPFAGAVVTLTTAGDAIVIVAVCVAYVSLTVQLVEATDAAEAGCTATADVTYAVVAIWVLLDAAGGVTASETVDTVCVPEPEAVTCTNGLNVDDVDTLNVVALILDT